MPSLACAVDSCFLCSLPFRYTPLTSHTSLSVIKDCYCTFVKNRNGCAGTRVRQLLPLLFLLALHKLSLPTFCLSIVLTITSALRNHSSLNVKFERDESRVQRQRNRLRSVHKARVDRMHNFICQTNKRSLCRCFECNQKGSDKAVQ